MDSITVNGGWQITWKSRQADFLLIRHRVAAEVRKLKKVDKRYWKDQLNEVLLAATWEEVTFAGDPHASNH